MPTVYMFPVLQRLRGRLQFYFTRSIAHEVNKTQTYESTQHYSFKYFTEKVFLFSKSMSQIWDLNWHLKMKAYIFWEIQGE